MLNFFYYFRTPSSWLSCLLSAQSYFFQDINLLILCLNISLFLESKTFYLLDFFINFKGDAFLKAIYEKLSVFSGFLNSLRLKFMMSSLTVYVHGIATLFFAFFFASLENFSLLTWNLETDTQVINAFNLISTFFLIFYSILGFSFLVLFLKLILTRLKLWNFSSLFFFFYGLFFILLLFLILLPLYLELLVNLLEIGEEALISFVQTRTLSLFLLALFFTYFIFILFIFSSDKNSIPFSAFYKQFLPLIFALILISSLFYIFLRFNLHYFFILLILSNISFLKTFYKEVWKDQILKSSILWHIFRFSTPAPLFLFGFEELVCGEVILNMWGWGFKNLGVRPKVTSFSRFLQVQPKPALFHQFTREFHESFSVYRGSPAIAKFLDKVTWRFLIKELILTKKQGYPSEALKNIFQELKDADLKIQKFLTLNTNFFGSREFLHLIFIPMLIKNPDFCLLPTVLLYPEESIPLLPLDSTKEFEDLPELLNNFYVKQRVRSPLIFSFEGKWYLSFDKNEETAFKFNDEAIIDILNAKVKQKELFYHNFTGLLGQIYARISTHDFFWIDLATKKSMGTVSAKSSFNNFGEWEIAKMYSIISVTTDSFTYIDEETSTIHLVKISKFINNEARFPLAQAVKNFQRIDEILSNEDTLRELGIETARNSILNHETTFMKKKLISKFAKNDEL